MKTIKTKSLVIAFSLFSLVFFAGCAEFNDPYPSSYGNSYGNDPYYNGGYHNDDYYREKERDRARHDRREIERERDRLEAERRRLEEERAREREASRYRPPPQQERCPSGYSPSENKCSAEERRRGCKDMRLPGGLGCVHR